MNKFKTCFPEMGVIKCKSIKNKQQNSFYQHKIF